MHAAAINMDGKRLRPQYPAAYTNDNIISVAALTSTGAMASYSNFGVVR